MGEISPWWIITAILAPSIFLLYDHLLTLGMEIQYIWLKPKRRSAYWFLTLRYLVSLGEFVIVVFRFYDTGSESGCLKLKNFIYVQTLLVELLVMLLMSVRVYALYECSRRIIWLIIAVAACLLPAVGWSVAMSSIGTNVLQGMVCGRVFPEQRVTYLTVTWGCAFAYDCLIFTLTIWKTYHTRRECKFGRIIVRIPLLELMMRDGAIYFGVMCVVHLANVILCATRSASMSSLVRTISAAMALRLMLNLHENASEGLLSRGISTLTTQNYVSTGLEFRSPYLDRLDQDEVQGGPSRQNSQEIELGSSTARRSEVEDLGSESGDNYMDRDGNRTGIT